MSQSVINDFAAAKQQLMDQACALSGLTDFGAGDFDAGLDLLLNLLEDEARPSTPFARQASASYIRGFLVSRLHSQAGWAAFPETQSPKIARPLIITGIPRSGTTALHRLLSMDPQFQGLETWIARTPIPRPPRATWEEDPRYQAVKVELEAMIAVAPELRDDHMMRADGVDENLMLLPQTFCNNGIATQWDLPTYDAWYRRQDETASYRRFAANLNLIGRCEPHRRWLLKNPTDTFAIDAVLNVFPEAMVVQTHRDPVQAIPSVVNLVAAAQAMLQGHVSTQRIMAREADFWREALRRMEAAKAGRPQQFFDVEFREFIQDQLGVVRRIYAHFGLGLSEPTEQRMRHWLAANPRRPGALQRHRSEEFGMSAASLAERYADYRSDRGYGEVA